MNEQFIMKKIKTKETKKKLQDNENGTEKKKKKKKEKEEKLEHCWTQHIKKELKKERTFFFK